MLSMSPENVISFYPIGRCVSTKDNCEKVKICFHSFLTITILCMISKLTCQDTCDNSLSNHIMYRFNAKKKKDSVKDKRVPLICRYVVLSILKDHDTSTNSMVESDWVGTSWYMCHRLATCLFASF